VRTLRIDRVTVVSPDATRAAATFGRLFGLAPAPAPGSPEALATSAVAIGNAQIEFQTPATATPLAEVLQQGGEGMAALTLTVTDLDEAIRTLRHDGIGFEPTTVSGRRGLVIDSRAAHGVRLVLMAPD